jgi:hypothetical protein
MNLDDSVAMSFTFAPDEHLDVRLFDFYDRVPTSLLRDPIGRAAARRALGWTGCLPENVSELITLPRPQFLKCLEAVGATTLLPSLMGPDAAVNMSKFSLVVSPFAREASFSAMRARVVTSSVARVDVERLEAIRLPRVIVELGSSAILASLNGYPEDFVHQVKAKLKGTGTDAYRIDSAVAKKIVDWCSHFYSNENRNVH